VGEAELGDQVLKAEARLGRGGRLAQVVVDDLDALLGPASPDGWW
jgi:hypothetical protein